MTLSDEKLNMLSGLVETASDELLRAMTHNEDPSMMHVRRLALEERNARRRRDLVLSPIVDLYPPPVRAALWRAGRRALSRLVHEALAVNLELEPQPPVFDTFCLKAAAALREAADPAWQDAVRECQAAGAECDELASRLELAAICRKAQSRLTDWTRRMTDDRIAAARLAYQDAVTLSPAAGYLFFEMLAVKLEEPWGILRVIAAVMSGPTDAYMAGSDLAPFAERALADIDECIEFVRRFDPAEGAAAGPPAAAQAGRAARGLVEFAAAIRLGPSGPWAKTIARQRLALASTVEARLKELIPLIEKLLPRRSSNEAANVPADPVLAARAAGMVAFADALHACADFGGFAAYRSKVIEALQAHLDGYVEEALDRLRKAQTDADSSGLRRRLDLAADLYGLARGEKAGEIVRRRTAA